MLSSPAKRRRTSTTTYNSIATVNDDTESRPTPTTPRRASYLSPTKASLSRSHPRILKERESLTARLREAAPNDIAVAVDSANDDGLVEVEPEAETEKETGKASLTDGAGSLSIAEFNYPAVDDIETAENGVADVSTEGLKTPQRKKGSSLMVYRSGSAARRIGPLPPESMSSIVPKLVQGKDSRTRAPSEGRSTDPDLPPTPVQLGMDPAPERPRGLVTSSSPGGGDRRRTRAKSDRLTSTPSKPKEKVIRILDPVTEMAEIASGVIEPTEAAEEEDTPRSSIQTEERADLDRRENRAELQRLQEEHLVLSQNLRALQTATQRVGQEKSGNHPSDGLGEVVSLINKYVEGKEDNKKTTTQPSSLSVDDSTAYLNLFAPANLQISFETTTKIIKQRTKLVHQITLKPPHPWPANALSSLMKVTIDADNAQIEDVSCEQQGTAENLGFQDASLWSWIANRSEHPLHKFDLGGLIWGIGTFFEQAVRRARIIQHLTTKYGSEAATPTSAKPLWDPSSEVVDTADAIMLLPFLATSRVKCALKQGKTTRTSKAIVLTYDINLDWTAKPSISVDILVAGVSAKAQHNARELFTRLLGSINVVTAFEKTWDVLNSQEVEGLPDIRPAKDQRKRKFVDGS